MEKLTVALPHLRLTVKLTRDPDVCFFFKILHNLSGLILIVSILSLYQRINPESRSRIRSELKERFQKEAP